MKRKSADSVSRCIQSVIYSEGAPLAIQTDNGKEFVNSEVQGLFRQYCIEFRRGRPRHPQNQGQIERANQTLVRRLAKATAESSLKCWINILSKITFEYNMTWHRGINKTPMSAFRNRIFRGSTVDNKNNVEGCGLL